MQTEAHGIELGKVGPRKAGRIVQWPPKLVTIPLHDSQAVAVMHARSVVVVLRTVYPRIKEHRRQRCDPQFGDIRTKEQPGGYIHFRRLAGPDHEPVSARDTWALKPGVDGNDRSACGIKLDIELGKAGKFLRFGTCRVQRQPPRA
jgi:hypothetical protein